MMTREWLVTGMMPHEGGCECLREIGHHGEHATKGHDGLFWAFYKDLRCDCKSCQSDNPEDWCEAYIEITQREMGELMMDKNLVRYDI
jgi:hypothetical protein